MSDQNTALIVGVVIFVFFIVLLLICVCAYVADSNNGDNSSTNDGLYPNDFFNTNQKAVLYANGELNPRGVAVRNRNNGIFGGAFGGFFGGVTRRRVNQERIIALNNRIRNENANLNANPNIIG